MVANTRDGDLELLKASTNRRSIAVLRRVDLAQFSSLPLAEALYREAQQISFDEVATHRCKDVREAWTTAQALRRLIKDAKKDKYLRVKSLREFIIVYCTERKVP